MNNLKLEGKVRNISFFTDLWKTRPFFSLWESYAGVCCPRAKIPKHNHQKMEPLILSSASLLLSPCCIEGVTYSCRTSYLYISHILQIFSSPFPLSHAQFNKNTDRGRRRKVSNLQQFQGLGFFWFLHRHSWRKVRMTGIILTRQGASCSHVMRQKIAISRSSRTRLVISGCKVG